MDPLGIAALLLATAALVGSGLLLYRTSQLRTELVREHQELVRRRDEAERDRERERKEMLLAVREEAHALRAEAESEARELRAMAQRSEDRLAAREESLARREARHSSEEAALREMQQEATALRGEAARLVERRKEALARAAGMSPQEARAELMRATEEELRLESARRLKEMEEQTRLEADRRAQRIVLQAIERCAVAHVSESTVSVVSLPSDEMKGRIIGREGRNIRAFETLTGVDVIIDDTPEAVVLSAFDPVRRETARLALSALIDDGRIHPGRIEEAVARAKSEVDASLRAAGESAAFRAGVALHPDLSPILGRLRFRTSFGQNVLDHSVEVAQIAATLAAELGADAGVARRAGLLHDLGKAMDSESDESHLALSVELARRYGESEAVIHAVAAHHGDVEFGSVEAVLVQVADAISASRPGARRDVLESYVRRMQKLEGIVSDLPGVERAFAVQAGRELRIIVDPEALDDPSAALLARDVARKIEATMEYPGQIRVTVIRELRAVEHAR